MKRPPHPRTSRKWHWDLTLYKGDYLILILSVFTWNEHHAKGAMGSDCLPCYKCSPLETWATRWCSYRKPEIMCIWRGFLCFKQYSLGSADCSISIVKICFSDSFPLAHYSVSWCHGNEMTQLRNLIPESSLRAFIMSTRKSKVRSQELFLFNGNHLYHTNNTMWVIFEIKNTVSSGINLSQE